jgi:hypothetical protein
MAFDSWLKPENDGKMMGKWWENDGNTFDSLMILGETWWNPTFPNFSAPRIRDEPDIDGPRTGEDLIRGSVFEAPRRATVSVAMAGGFHSDGGTPMAGL